MHGGVNLIGADADPGQRARVVQHLARQLARSTHLGAALLAVKVDHLEEAEQNKVGQWTSRSNQRRGQMCLENGTARQPTPETNAQIRQTGTFSGLGNLPLTA